LATALGGCGGSSAPDEPSSAGSTAGAPISVRTITDVARPPKIVLPPGQSPHRLIVRDLRRGSGPGIPPRKEVEIKSNFTSLNYQNGKPHEVHWSRHGSFNIPFGPRREIEGWEKGLIGMRVGGRRELRVPSRMVHGHGAVLYVVDLLSWRPISSPLEVESEKVSK
jgi:peptidylprolyl isomerase